MSYVIRKQNKISRLRSERTKLPYSFDPGANKLVPWPTVLRLPCSKLLFGFIFILFSCLHVYFVKCAVFHVKVFSSETSVTQGNE